MTNKEKAKKIVRILIKRYGAEMPLYLYYHKNKPYEFLFAVMMSAQCTDERVNLVTKGLYKKYNSLHKFANANIKTLENDVFSVGFYHNKAKNLIACARKLILDYGGKVPRDFDDLLSLPGVGRKTASVVVGTLYNKPAMAVDTHVARISNILFKLSTKDVGVIEGKLKEIVEKKYWNLWNTHIIALGREICVARRPKCDICPLYNICKDKL
ncbi:MAG: endonuclease III [Lachnospiraceae bacterium]|nr:endonuclease III [Lachnospiraceae bacterium]